MIRRYVLLHFYFLYKFLSKLIRSTNKQADTTSNIYVTINTMNILIKYLQCSMT